MPEETRPKGLPRRLEYVGSVEWASGPRHSRFDSYYLNPRGKYWLLWIYSQDENSWNMAWRWTLYAYGLKKGVDAKSAAIYLLLDAWQAERDELDLHQFFLVDEAGLLSVAEFLALGNSVWPDG
jgi:hypothetical protein